MSIVNMLVCFVFLGFFLFVVPLSIYLFARFFPNKYPSFIGFPEDPVRTRDIAKIVRAVRTDRTDRTDDPPARQ
jgi:hypothetical protein